MSIFAQKKCVPTNAARSLSSSEGSLDCPVLVHNSCSDPLCTPRRPPRLSGPPSGRDGRPAACRRLRPADLHRRLTGLGSPPLLPAEAGATGISLQTTHTIAIFLCMCLDCVCLGGRHQPSQRRCEAMRSDAAPPIDPGSKGKRSKPALMAAERLACKNKGGDQRYISNPLAIRSVRILQN